MQEETSPGEGSSTTSRVFGVSISAPVKWVGSQELPVLYADQMYVQGLAEHMVITFGLTSLPVEPMTEELSHRLETDGVEISAVTRVAVSPGLLRRMIRALTLTQEQWLEQNQSLAESHGEEA